jgi:hypothetical protein
MEFTKKQKKEIESLIKCAALTITMSGTPIHDLETNDALLASALIYYETSNQYQVAYKLFNYMTGQKTFTDEERRVGVDFITELKEKHEEKL